MLRKLHFRDLLKGCVDWSSCYKEEMSFVNSPGDRLSFRNLLRDWPLCPVLDTSLLSAPQCGFVPRGRVSFLSWNDSLAPIIKPLF